jgi:hypothetical protein
MKVFKLQRNSSSPVGHPSKHRLLPRLLNFTHPMIIVLSFEMNKKLQYNFVVNFLVNVIIIFFVFVVFFFTLHHPAVRQFCRSTYTITDNIIK